MTTLDADREQAVTEATAARRRLADQIVFRLGDSLYDALVADAECNGRTVAQTVRFRLEQALGLR